MAKVSELIDQARALEAQGENSKALAIYQHVLPHLEGMPAIKADLALKAGDLMLKLGDKPGALGMFDTAGTQCAFHGSTKGVLAVAAKIQQAAPERSDALLTLAAQMVKHGHAGHAVDVLIQYAKQANLPEMLQELQPLAGRPSEDVRPQVQMLLEQPASAAPSSPPPPPPPPPPSPPRRRSSEPEMDDLLTPLSLEEQLSSIAPPSAPVVVPSSSMYDAPPPPPPPPPPPLPTPSVFSAPSPPPAFSAPPPPPPPPSTELVLDVSPPLPLSPRETAEINLRTSQSMREVVADEPEAPARRPSAQTRTPATAPRPAATYSGRSRSKRWLAIPVVLAGVAGGLFYFGLLPQGLVQQVRGIMPGGSATPDVTPAAVPESTTVARVAPRPAPVFPGPGTRPPPAAPHAPPSTRVETGSLPPVRIEGLEVTDFRESTGGERFQVVQRQESGQYLTLTGRPLADTVGEPAVGEIRLDSLPPDTAIATTAFEGYVIVARGVIAPAALQSLLLQLVARP